MRPGDRLDLVFHAVCMAADPFSRERVGKVLSDLDDGSAGPGWRTANERWRLPLYEYPGRLDADLRRFLLRCFAEWTGEPRAETIPVGDATIGQAVRFEEASVTLWTPNVLLVMHRAHTWLHPQQDVYALIDAIALALYPATDELVGRALDEASGLREPDDPSEPAALAKVASSIDREVLWVVGTGFLPPHDAPADPGRPSRLRTLATTARRMGRESSHGVTESPDEVGALKIYIKNLVTVVAPGDSYATDADSQRLRDAVEKFILLMSLQNLVWAVAIHYDRSLLRHIAEKDVDIRRRRLREVENEGRDLVSLFHVVSSFRATLGSMQIHLEREAYAYWTYLNKVWDFDGYVESIAGKMESLAEIHREVTAAVGSRRARRLGVAAFAFTALGVVTVGLAVLGLFAKDVDAVSLGVLGGVLLLGVLAVAALFVFWFGLAEPGTRRSGELADLLGDETLEGTDIRHP